MKKLMVICALTFCAAFTAGQTWAVGQVDITLVPSTTKIHQGENLFVDVMMSGLQSGGVDNLLGAWEMQVTYDDDLFDFLPVPPAGFGDRLGDVLAGEAIGDIDASISGIIDLYVVSLLTDAELDDRQREPPVTGPLLDGFRLATVGFYAPFNASFSGPTTTFDTDNIVLSDPFGFDVSDINGDPMPIINLPETIQVSEPGSLLLFGVSLSVMFSRRSKRNDGIS